MLIQVNKHLLSARPEESRWRHGVPDLWMLHSKHSLHFASSFASYLTSKNAYISTYVFFKFLCVPKLTPEYFIILSHSTLFARKHSMVPFCPLGNAVRIQSVWKMTSSCSTKLDTSLWIRARHGSYKSALLAQSSILSVLISNTAPDLTLGLPTAMS